MDTFDNKEKGEVLHFQRSNILSVLAKALIFP